MKYVFILAIFSICVFIGYAVSLKYTKRKRFFASMISLADKLSLEINFSRERLKVLVENVDKSTHINLLGIDQKFVDFLDRKIDLTQQALFDKNDMLKNEEKDTILLFFKTLGRSDVENQIKEIQGFSEKFKEMKKQCDLEQKKYGSLSFKLGIIAGLFFIVIMI